MNHRIKSSFLIILFLATSKICTAQQDSLVDIFPLAIGNSLIYDFSTDYYAGMNHYEERDTGISICKVVSTLASVDSTSWQLSCKRDFIRYRYSNGVPQVPISMNDSLSFEIMEINADSHKLYIPSSGYWSSDWLPTSVFPIWNLSRDSIKFYRYVSVDSTGHYIFSGYLRGMTSVQRNITVYKEVGVVQSTGRVADFNSNVWIWRYSLRGSPSQVYDNSETLKPTHYYLKQNYPNPFNPSTIIGFDIPVAGFVSLKMYDLIGREVATLVNEEMRPGTYNRVFDGRFLATGVYLFRMQAGHFSQSKKLLLLR